ncbi:ankyrin repeat domain-containing protein [Corynebacterium pacaense]|uniref:ankyrin repeat domain-containing protein n=1 Tax=Corynebacterium pacaense TaxID=1816684 RepID=UPI0009B9FCEE|nr:ankyrin repeat domain-containing protein [Corynebacterium pacaense]
MLPTAPGNNDRNLINYIDGGRYRDLLLTGDLAQLDSLLAFAGPDARDEEDRTVLMRAAEAGNLLFVARLLDMGADSAITDPTGLTALHYAAIEGDDGIIEILIDAGANLDAPDDRDRTPLWYACAHNLPDSAAVEILLRAGADCHRRDSSGVSPDDML